MSDISHLPRTGFRGLNAVKLAQIWFSAYSTLEGKRLAAIVVDSSDEMRDREERGLDQLLTGNELIVAAMAHEVRNACEAMGMLCEDLEERYRLGQDNAFRSLDNLVAGLEVIASHELKSETTDLTEEVLLKDVLDDLRIVVEPAWREIEGTVRWHLPEDMPFVCAEPHGLLQAFLNLAQNSHRAVQEEAVRELNISVSSKEQKVFIKFHDSGPGIQNPETTLPARRFLNGVGTVLVMRETSVMRNTGTDLVPFSPTRSVTLGACGA